ncbi:uncharacterized protein [Henckelia pumila]|uniref:uncharacterized protein isoform X4 n=1 Tax=Henckelia pumila TaxID=405737 RepID=UPI003C6E9DDE
MPLLRYKRCFGFLNSQQKSCHFFVKSYMGSPEETHSSPPAEHHGVSLQEWQAWGTTSPVPSMVNQIIRDLKMLEMETDSHITFGGNHGTLSGDFKVQEDKKHRAKYASLADSEEKLQFFSARQIACRLLGSRGYLCQKCWLASEDCMCSRVATCLLAKQLHIWLYMHPKDFLRQNNTGKLLWQVFGIHAATLCLFGITEHEEKMWNVFQLEGRNKVWCLYPNKNAPTFSVTDIISHSRDLERQENGEDTMNFILIDGTWNNSNAMFRRLQDRAKLIWGSELPCISLNTGVSLMHKLRPQPSWDRTCTAAAAIGLLHELQHVQEFSSFELDKQAEAIEHSLEVLLETLTTRRLRMGRSISRRGRHNDDIC